MGGASKLTLTLVELRLLKDTPWGGADGAEGKVEDKGQTQLGGEDTQEHPPDRKHQSEGQEPSWGVTQVSLTSGMCLITYPTQLHLLIHLLLHVITVFPHGGACILSARKTPPFTLKRTGAEAPDWFLPALTPENRKNQDRGGQGDHEGHGWVRQAGLGGDPKLVPGGFQAG